MKGLEPTVVRLEDGSAGDAARHGYAIISALMR
jgi:hypothetical protein